MNANETIGSHCLFQTLPELYLNNTKFHENRIPNVEWDCVRNNSQQTLTFRIDLFANEPKWS